MVVKQEEKETHKFSSHNPKLALVLSIIPGLGQFYNRRFMKGSIFLVLAASFLIAFADFLNIGLWGIFTLGTQVGRDHSLELIIQGLVSIILLLFGLVFYYINLQKMAFTRFLLHQVAHDLLGCRRSILRCFGQMKTEFKTCTASATITVIRLLFIERK